MNKPTVVKPTFKDFKGILHWAVFFVYSQTLLVFFWNLQSLLLRFSLGEVLGFLSYQLTFSFIESCTSAFAILIITSIIPIKHVRNNIQSTGSLLMIALAISAVLFKEARPLNEWLTTTFMITPDKANQIVAFGLLYAIICLPIISIIITRHNKINDKLLHYTDNLSTLGWIYLATSILGIVNVIYRNLL